MRYYVALGAREVLVDVVARPDGGWEASIDGHKIDVDVVPLTPQTAGRSTASLLSLRVGTKIIDLMVDSSAPELAFAAVGLRGQARVESEWARGDTSVGHHRRSDGPDVVVSPMPGRVVRVLAAVEETVERGAPLVVVEAMKMENELRAPRAGRVAEILVGAGDTVEAGAKLIVIA